MHHSPISHLYEPNFIIHLKIDHSSHGQIHLGIFIFTSISSSVTEILNQV